MTDGDKNLSLIVLLGLAIPIVALIIWIFA